jgi:hypothetical protein
MEFEAGSLSVTLSEPISGKRFFENGLDMMLGWQKERDLLADLGETRELDVLLSKAKEHPP